MHPLSFVQVDDIELKCFELAIPIPILDNKLERPFPRRSIESRLDRANNEVWSKNLATSIAVLFRFEIAWDVDQEGSFGIFWGKSCSQKKQREPEGSPKNLGGKVTKIIIIMLTMMMMLINMMVMVLINMMINMMILMINMMMMVRMMRRVVRFVP